MLITTTEDLRSQSVISTGRGQKTPPSLDLGSVPMRNSCSGQRASLSSTPPILACRWIRASGDSAYLPRRAISEARIWAFVLPLSIGKYRCRLKPFASIAYESYSRCPGQPCRRTAITPARGPRPPLKVPLLRAQASQRWLRPDAIQEWAIPGSSKWAKRRSRVSTSCLGSYVAGTGFLAAAQFCRTCRLSRNCLQRSQMRSSSFA